MIIAKTVKEAQKQLSTVKKAGKTVGLVPTMGALHAGHYSLIDQCRRQSDFCCVSIFVNPTQFGPNEDLDNYPNTFEADCAGCKKIGADLIFAPNVSQMYPDQNLTWINVEKLTEQLCGDSRPIHFRGVCTVVAKLFNIIQPDYAWFGQKDAQQLAVIKRMVADLNFPVEIRQCPIVRENDGLAMSSRNKYLDAIERRQAVCLYKSLLKARDLFNDGMRESSHICNEIQNIINNESRGQIDYISIVDNELLTPVSTIQSAALLALAVYFGATRLIDNIILDPNDIIS